jgi:hypothetical protein
MQRKVVVLPQPEGPSREMNSPCQIYVLEDMQGAVELVDPVERQRRH